MIIQSTVEIAVTAKAVVRDDTIKLELTASAPYANRQATATLNITDEKIISQLEKVMAKAIEAHGEEVAKLAQVNAAQAMVAAARLGEV